jgi:hypothetical protein
VALLVFAALSTTRSSAGIDVMRRDLLLGALALLVSGMLAWLFAGNPLRHSSRLHKSVELVDDSNLKQVTEESPLMRNER